MDIVFERRCKSDFVEDDFHAAFNELDDALIREAAIGSIGNAVIEDKTISRPQRDMLDGENFAWEAINTRRLAKVQHMDVCIISEGEQFGVAMDACFHRCPEAIVPNVAAFERGMAAQQALWQPEIEAAMVGKKACKKQFF